MTQVPGRSVGPVQVLEHQQDRARGRELGEQAEHAAEHLLPGQAGAVRVDGGASAALGQQHAQGRTRAQRVTDRAGNRGAPQRVRQRQVGHAVAELRALAGQVGEPAARGEPRDLRHQPGFAHPRVAADQCDDRASRLSVIEQAEQAAEFVVPPDHAAR